MDVNREIKDNVPEVWIWGIDDKDRRILLIKRGFKPYFYVKLREDFKEKSLIDEIQRDRVLRDSIVGIDVCDRRLFGKPVKAIRIVCRDTESMEGCVKKLSVMKEIDEVLEDDIRYAIKYLIDNDLSPSSWYEAEVEETGGYENVRVDGTYILKTEPKPLERSETPNLRILSFSMISCNPLGEPKARRDPIATLSVLTDKGKSRQFVLEDLDEESLIRSFIDFVNEVDPDIIVGYETNTRLWDYLIERCKIKKVKLRVGRTDTVPHRSVYGHVSITGRINLDLYDYVEDLSEVKLKTLWNFANFLGIPVDEDKLIDEMDLSDHWENEEKQPKLLAFSMSVAQTVMSVLDKVLDYAIQLSSLVGIPLDYVGSASAGYKVEWLIIRRAKGLGELIPRRVERPYYTYVGGMVLKPKRGLHNEIAVLDFKSLYPNIMIKFNVSPDTYVEPSIPLPEEDVFVAPEVKHRFLKEPSGLYKDILLSLVSTRDRLREKLEEMDVDSPSYRIYDARQKAIKVITNAVYGYAGWLGARWYVKPVAEAASAWGRYVIRKTLDLSEDLGLSVVYGDTDSVFVEFDEEKIKLLSEKIYEEVGLEIRQEKKYLRLLFTEAKKRYCGLMEDGRLDIVGLEVVRGDWAEVAKKVQENVLRLILEGRPPEKAKVIIDKYVSDLKEGKIPMKDLVIWKTITKPIEKYRVNAPHLEAAKKLIGAGWPIYPNDKVGYVIVSGDGPLYSRAVPYSLASKEEIDIDYYISKQIMPPVKRVLSVFNVKI